MRGLGTDNGTTVKLRGVYAQSIYEDDTSTLDHLREAVTILETESKRSQRVFGPTHNITRTVTCSLHQARKALAKRESSIAASSSSA